MIDTIIRVASPDGIAFDLHPAGSMVRVLAYLIDVFLQYIAIIIIIIVLAVVKITGDWTVFLATFAVMWFYMVFFELFLAGRSPGKMILGLQVVLSDGSPVHLGASLLRNLLRAFDFFFAIGMLVPLFNEGFRRLGDIVAGTLVVYTPERLTRLGGKPDFSGIEAMAPQRILGREAAEVILSYAQRRKGFSPELRKELARAASDVYLIDPGEEDAEKAALALAAWYAGMRPTGKTGAL
jgi:uncharacterized RDD family membrane protein YckC